MQKESPRVLAHKASMREGCIREKQRQRKIPISLQRLELHEDMERGVLRDRVRLSGEEPESCDEEHALRC